MNMHDFESTAMVQLLETNAGQVNIRAIPTKMRGTISSFSSVLLPSPKARPDSVFQEISAYVLTTVNTRQDLQLVLPLPWSSKHRTG